MHIARIQSQLESVSADCNYEDWRNIVWAVLSTRWTIAEDLARQWSMNAPDRFDEKAFNLVVRSFDPTKGITPGTLYHHAQLAGWQCEGTVHYLLPWMQ